MDTDPKASPFDICMAYDAGYNAVIPYENVTAEDSKTVALDAWPKNCITQYQEEQGWNQIKIPDLTFYFPPCIGQD